MLGKLQDSMRAGETVSLEGLHGTVPVPAANASFWRQARAFVGPAFLVSVGYMDPGNWGTDLQAGAEYRFGLLWVVGVASLMAVIMQIIAARLGVVTGKDLAQACRDYYPAWTRIPLWLFCEVAIGATDLAEMLGSAVALNLLFHIPLLWAVLITAFDVLLLLALQGRGMRFIEALIVVLVATIGGCYFIEIFVLPQTQPDFLDMGRALLSPGLRETGMVVLAIGIIGATVMPHNLYLHSALVHSRKLGRGQSSLPPVPVPAVDLNHFDPAAAQQDRADGEQVTPPSSMDRSGDGMGQEPVVARKSMEVDREEITRRAIRFNTLDTLVALSIAFLVNAAILVLAAHVFHGQESVTLASGAVIVFEPDSDWIRVAYLTLAPLLGIGLASTLFAVALLASGQSSTITGTLAGQVVMEGFLHWRIRPWVRRLITRLLAVLPAIFIIAWRGDTSITELLVWSQFVLALQLPFAMFPLLHFTSSRRRMGPYANGWFLLIAGWSSAIVITALAFYGLFNLLKEAVIAGS
jgi:manganese transport protein